MAAFDSTPVSAALEALEHVLSEELESRIAAKLGHPTHDPHGDPIPTADLSIDEGRTRRFGDLAPGDRGRFVRAPDGWWEKRSSNATPAISERPAGGTA